MIYLTCLFECLKEKNLRQLKKKGGVENIALLLTCLAVEFICSFLCTICIMRTKIEFSISNHHFCNAVNSFQTLFSQSIIGSIVLTNYNNKTYRVDEVDYAVTPLSSFETKKRGETSEITYVKYYQEVRMCFCTSKLECIFIIFKIVRFKSLFPRHSRLV